MPMPTLPGRWHGRHSGRKRYKVKYRMPTDEMQQSQLDGVVINKGIKLRYYKFTDVFKGFENVDAVKKLFGKDTKRILSKLKVMLFSSKWGYLWVDDRNMSIGCNYDYIKEADKRHVYLDVIHELMHIKQGMEGRKLFNDNFEYVDSPTELEAYREGVAEAKRIGMSDKEIIEYLKVDWVGERDFKRLLRALGMA
ncbi:MAG: hypothetical protein M1528_02310 [Candidatus Marsarchaeota archaeon]|nr:hypothetical protein [Candidatus Marsarchaeota archaeon]MCL5115342.1 hypothetical protein [Candidatus Marsarchaeota archaeon]